MTSVRKLAIIVGYVAVFWCALPSALWLLGAAVDAAAGFAPLSDAWRVGGAAVAVAGASFTVWSMWTLSRSGKGLPISHLPPRELVVSGPYRFFRHPIYVGFNVAWLGVGLASGSVGRATASTAALFIAWQLYTKLYEEPALAKRFPST